MMEKEYKWKADTALLNAAMAWASNRPDGQSRTLRMHSRYYDTADRQLYAKGIGLRLRKENERSVCCMKIRGDVEDANGLRERAEYQCDAASVQEGLSRLPYYGAPAELCHAIAAAPLELLCETEFQRCAILIREGDTVCEMALDEGEMRRAGRAAPLCEIEMELLAGDETTFHLLAEKLARALSLVPEPLSKLARASAL